MSCWKPRCPVTCPDDGKLRLCLACRRAQSGEVCSDPFTQEELNARLGAMLSNLDSAPWSENGLAYGKQPELYSLTTAAVRYIEDRADAGSQRLNHE